MFILGVAPPRYNIQLYCERSSRSHSQTRRLHPQLNICYIPLILSISLSRIIHKLVLESFAPKISQTIYISQMNIVAFWPLSNKRPSFRTRDLLNQNHWYTGVWKWGSSAKRFSDRRKTLLVYQTPASRGQNKKKSRNLEASSLTLESLNKNYGVSYN